MKKRVLSLLLALVLCLGLLPTVSLATSSGTCGNGVTWTLDDSGRLTIDGHGAMDDYEIPWRELRPNITSIVIKGGVTYVGYQVFWNCNNVESITVEEGVTTLGSEAFASLGSKEKGCRVTLPSTITEIPWGVFEGSRISSVNIPSSVTSIGVDAFNCCRMLTSITIPASVKTISGRAFWNCIDLTSITLQGVPNTVGNEAFYKVPTSGTFSFNGTRAQWDALAAGGGSSTEDLLFGAGRDTPTIRILGESPKETITMELANKGTVELSEDNPNLVAIRNAPVGTEETSRSLTLYTADGKYIDTMEYNRKGVTTSPSGTISYPLWRTPQNGKLVYDNCSLTLGETYRYEIRAVLNGEVYTTGMGTFRLAKPQTETFTVSFLNPLNMAYYPDIQVTNGQPYGKLPTPTMYGQIFDGWYTADKEKITSDTIVNLTKDQTLFAYWSQEEPVTLTNDNTPTNGVVEINPSNSQLKAILSAPKGKKVSQWDMTIYNTNGGVVTKMSETPNGFTTGEDVPMVLRLWTIGGTPKEGQVLDYGNYTLTVGTTYEYEFTAVVEGVTYRTGKAKFRLSTTAQPQQPGGVENIPASGTAYARNQEVKLDGKTRIFQAYALRNEAGDMTHYIKLRDLGDALNGTRVQFEVGYNGSIVINRGKPYNPNGSEGSTPFSGDRSYKASAAKIIIDGREVPMTAFVLTDNNGGGYTYFKIRDLAQALDFQVGWDGAICIDTSKPYSD